MNASMIFPILEIVRFQLAMLVYLPGHYGFDVFVGKWGFVGWLLHAVPDALLYETGFLTVLIKSWYSLRIRFFTQLYTHAQEKKSQGTCAVGPPHGIFDNIQQKKWLVVSKVFCFHPELWGRWTHVWRIFFRWDWFDHQLDKYGVHISIHRGYIPSYIQLPIFKAISC